MFVVQPLATGGFIGCSQPSWARMFGQASRPVVDFRRGQPHGFIGLKLQTRSVGASQPARA